MMKRKLLVFSLVLLVFGLFYSCEKDDDFDEYLLYGKWVSGTLYYKYLPNHTGATWDTSDDVTEEEAQPFEWQLVKSELRQIHIMEMGGRIPKYYTITKLTNNTLIYKDDYRSWTFTKTN